VQLFREPTDGVGDRIAASGASVLPEHNRLAARGTSGIRKRGGICLELAKIASVLVRFNHIARFIVNANHGIV